MAPTKSNPSTNYVPSIAFMPMQLCREITSKLGAIADRIVSQHHG
ncbi:MAG: hypothetical protein WA885_10020 [Phormidesmis sp.]